MKNTRNSKRIFWNVFLYNALHKCNSITFKISKGRWLEIPRRNNFGLQHNDKFSSHIFLPEQKITDLIFCFLGNQALAVKTLFMSEKSCEVSRSLKPEKRGAPWFSRANAPTTFAIELPDGPEKNKNRNVLRPATWMNVLIQVIEEEFKMFGVPILYTF